MKNKNYCLMALKNIVLLITFSVNAAPKSLPDPLNAGWKGMAVCEKLQDDSSQRILRCTFPPGVGHERHYHLPNFGYALSGGRVRIKDANGVREINLQTDSSFMSQGTSWHEIMNIGNTTIKYLIVERKDKSS